MVDHRSDSTFSLIVPKDNSFTSIRPLESYQIIHDLLSSSLKDCGVSCEILKNDSKGGASCFSSVDTDFFFLETESGDPPWRIVSVELTFDRAQVGSVF